jgi:hypothetical protein
MKTLTVLTSLAMLIVARQSRLFGTPSVTSVTPINAEGPHIMFKVVYIDPTGNSDLSNAYLVFDSGLKDGTEQCWIIYLAQLTRWTLRRDFGSALVLPVLA